MLRKTIFAITTLAALSGCSLFEETQKGPLVAGGSKTIEDVPVPHGFRYTDEGSSSHVDMEKKSRSAVQVYFGKAALLRVAEFYQAQLPQNKWSNTVATQQPSSFTITATKQGEILSIRTWDSTFYTYIEVTLKPQEPATKPAK